MSATREVETAIATIQEGTGKSSTTVDGTVTSIEEVGRMAEESGQSLERISSLAGDSSSRVSAIAAAATEQSAASEEINRNIAEVNTLSAHIAEAMDTAARQVSDMAGQVSVVTGILDVHPAGRQTTGPRRRGGVKNARRPDITGRLVEKAHA